MSQDSRSLHQRAWRVAIHTCLALLLGSLPALAQTISGRIDGHVYDSSGGVLPGATVTVVNEGTGFTRVLVSDETGLYTATNLPVGTYSVTAELQGFRRQQKTGISLTADGRLTTDFALGVGELTESVEVTAAIGETVNRTSGEVARTIDSQQIKDLAFNGRNYLELASLIPGAVTTDFDPLALATSLSVTGQSINGSRGNTNNLTVDGTSNMDSGSNGSQINNVSLSFIDQVKIQTSNFSAEVGRNSGAAVNVVTRSGTNSYRGTARYDIRDEKFDSANYFAPIGADGKKTKPPLEFRNFEGAFGGPILRNKLFFFGGQQYRTINRFTNPTRQTLPTTAELNGDFSFRLRGADGIVGTADDGVLRDPTTNAQFPGNVIPAEPHHDGRPGDGQHLPRDAGQGGDLHRYADRQQHDLPGIQPVRVAAGHHPHRLAGHGQAAALRPLHPRRVHPDRAVRHVLRCRHAHRPDRPVAPGHQLPGGPHLRGEHEPDQRGEDRRVLERPAHQAGGRLLAARHVRLPVPRTVRRAGLRRRRHPERDGGRLCRHHGAVVRLAVADDRHHGAGHPDLDHGQPLDPHRRGHLAQPQGPERPRQLLRLGQLQRRRQPEQHQQLRRRHAARQLPHLRRGLGRPGRLLPVHHVSGLRVRHLARAQQPEPRDRPPVRVHGSDLRAGQQPRELRPVAVRPQPGRDRPPERAARAGYRQPLQRARHRGRRHSRGSAGPCRPDRGWRLRARSPSARRGACTTRSTCSCRASASRTR